MILDETGEPLGTADVEVPAISTIDGPALEPDYADYDVAGTTVLTYTVMEDLLPGTAPVDPKWLVGNRADARAKAEQVGRVVGENYVPGRAFIRVVPHKEVG